MIKLYKTLAPITREIYWSFYDPKNDYRSCFSTDLKSFVDRKFDKNDMLYAKGSPEDIPNLNITNVYNVETIEELIDIVPEEFI